MIIPKYRRQFKGAPAQESLTRTWLVSPAAGREKKNHTLFWAPEKKLSTVTRIYLTETISDMILTETIKEMDFFWRLLLNLE